MVEYASTFLMSSCTNASAAPIRTVIPPIAAIGLIPPAAIEKPLKNTGYTRAPRYTPATTIVAAWMSAETGVGPAIASGNHVCNGNWPDLPMIASISAAAHHRINVWPTLWPAAPDTDEFSATML